MAGPYRGSYSVIPDLPLDRYYPLLYSSGHVVRFRRFTSKEPVFVALWIPLVALFERCIMSVESIAERVRKLHRRQGFWACCRWCKNQGYEPSWFVKVLFTEEF